MKQRTTYIVRDPDSFTPEQLEVKERSITLRKVQAAKERRDTVGLGELPVELAKAFEQWHELHIRWASSKPYASLPPFTSRVTPGLHVLFTPHKDQTSPAQLCTFLHSAFGPDLKCSSTAESSSKLPVLSERFSMSATSQYFSYVPTLDTFVEFIRDEVCRAGNGARGTKCRSEVKELLNADYLDVDYDAISHAVVMNAFWSTAPAEKHWTETISQFEEAQAVEVGVLTHERSADPEDIGFGGFLTVLGQDTAPKPTRFQTPTRHYPLPSPQTYKTFFPPPTGLHPTLTVTFPTLPTAPNPTCKLHTHLTLPSYLILDKYQFSDSLFLASHHLKSLRSISGVTDLEAPDWVVPAWGSAALFEIAVPRGGGEGGREWNVTVPLHLRYLPAAEASHEKVAVPWPVVFWACRAEEGTKMAVNPFDRLHLGYEALFGPKTRFMHLSPAEKGNGTGGLVEWIDVPVLDLRQTRWVEVGTIGTVVVAFLGLCWMLFGGKGGERKVEKGGKETKKKQ